MTALAALPWLPDHSGAYVHSIATATADASGPDVLVELDRLVEENRRIHDRDCVNLNPATNIMNPRAEAMLSSGLGSRPSLGYPGEKYEMGLEAIEQIEVIAAELAAEVFDARYAEIRVPSGAIANLYAFMATCEPGDTIIAPPPSIGGHVTHHAGGSAGMYRLHTVPAPVDAARFTVDVDALRVLALEHRPRMITIGASMNLYPHPVAELREIADEVGAVLLFDAAHLCGLIAGGAWPNPLDAGRTPDDDEHLQEPRRPTRWPDRHQRAGDRPAPRRDRLPRPDGELRRRQGRRPGGDAARLEGGRGRVRRDDGRDGRRARHRAAATRGLPVFQGLEGATRSHQFALEAHQWGGGQHAAKRLRRANLLACGIGLPMEPWRVTSTGSASALPSWFDWG